VDLQEQTAQHNAFLNAQPLDQALFDGSPDIAHSTLAQVTLLCEIDP
jgi:hypothetical protein